MSTKTPTRRDLNQLINVCCGAHDLVCDCYEPTKHIILHIFSNEEPYKVTNIYKSYVLVIISNFLKPQLPYYIPIDDEFIEGKSPYIPDTITQQQLHEHQQNWYPSLQYQLRAIRKNVRTGPGHFPKFRGV